MRPLLRALSLFVLFGCLPGSFSYVVNRDFSSHGGRLRRSPDLIYQSRGNFFIPTLAGRSDGGDDDSGEFKTNAISYDRKPTFLSLRSLAQNKQSLVGFGPLKATTTTTTTTTEATTPMEMEIPVVEGKLEVPVIEGKSDISFIPANNNIPFIRQVPPPSFVIKNDRPQVQTAPAVFGGPSNTDDGFVNPAAAQPPAQPGQQPDALSNSPASLASNNVDASGFIPAHPAATPSGQMASIAGRQDFGSMPDAMNGLGGSSGFPQMGGAGQFPGQMPMQDQSQFGMPQQGMGMPQQGMGMPEQGMGMPQQGMGMPQQGMMGQSPNFFPGADTMNPQMQGMPGGAQGADQFTSQQTPQFGTQNNIFQQRPLPNNPGQFDQFSQGMGGGGGMPGQFPQMGGDASNLAPLDPSLQPQQPPPGSQFDPAQQMQGAQFQPQFQQQFPQQFGQGDPQQFGQGGPQQFGQGGPQQFGQGGPQQFGQPGPAQGTGQFMPPEANGQFNPNAASDGMFIPVPGQSNSRPQDSQNVVPASQPQPDPEQSKIEEVTVPAPDTTSATIEAPKPETNQDEQNAAVPSDANANQENPGEAQQRAFFDPAPMPAASSRAAQLVAAAQQLQQPQQQPGIPLQASARDIYGSSDQAEQQLQQRGMPLQASAPDAYGASDQAQQLQQSQQQPGMSLQASARDAYGASSQGGYASGMAGPQGYSGGQTNYVGGGGYAGGGGYGGGRGGAGGSRYSPFLGGIGGGTGFGYPSGGAPYPYGAYGGFGYGYRPYYLGYNYDLAPYGIPQPTDFLLYGKNTLHPEKTYYLKGATDSAASGGTGK